MSLRIRFHPSVAPPADLAAFPADALAELLAEEGFVQGEVHCVLTGDEELADLNDRFRETPGPTDVLAFGYDPDLAGGTLGDIYVSLDRARDQAVDRGEPVGREVWRLFVHGALHLAGHDHRTPAEDRAMRERQERWVERGYRTG